MSNYLKFVFPAQISIERNKETVVPKYFTFMSTDCDGINAYFHCLVFYEQISSDLQKDFDKATAESRQQRQKEDEEHRHYNLSFKMKMSKT
jgi:hypothetical protein